MDRLPDGGGNITIAGWAGTTDPVRAASRVLAFAEDRFLAAAQPSLARPDLERQFGAGLGRAGFEVGGGSVERAAPPSVRVFAVLGRRASQIGGAGSR